MNGWTGGEGEERDSSLCNFLNRAESSFSLLSSRGDTIDRDSGAPRPRDSRRTPDGYRVSSRSTCPRRGNTRQASRPGAPSWGARTRSARRYVSRLIRSITYKQFPLMGKDRILPLLYESD